jgi:hypothetical protein
MQERLRILVVLVSLLSVIAMLAVLCLIIVNEETVAQAIWVSTDTCRGEAKV